MYSLGSSLGNFEEWHYVPAAAQQRPISVQSFIKKVGDTLENQYRSYSEMDGVSDDHRCI